MTAIAERRALGLRTVALLPALAALLGLAVLAGAGIGAVPIAPLDAVAILCRAGGLPVGAAIGDRETYVLLAIRLPRLLLGILIGSGLGMAGAGMQGIFRNPLADPGLIGTSSGAALAANAMIVLGGSLVLPRLLTEWAVPLAAFAGALAASMVVFRYAGAQAAGRVSAMLVAGIAVNAFAGAGTGLFAYLANDAQLRTLTFWNLGGLGGATWETLAVAAPFMACAALLPRHARRLDALLLGDAEAGHLGVDVRAVRRKVIVLAALCVGASVSVAGIIGFVGLAAPHLARSLAGSAHRRLIVCSGLIGATLVVASDTIARVVVSPAELPIGIVTAMLGTPLLVWLLRHGPAVGARR